jgi:hypothetical protein
LTSSFARAFMQCMQTVTFDASSSYDVDGTIVGYYWDFGDGNMRARICYSSFFDMSMPRAKHVRAITKVSWCMSSMLNQVCQ